MKTKITILSALLVLGILAVSAKAKASSYIGPQPEGYKYDLGANNLSIFKLFTIQPDKKSNVQRQNRAKSPAHKVETADKKDQIFVTPSLDRIRR